MVVCLSFLGVLQARRIARVATTRAKEKVSQERLVCSLATEEPPKSRQLFLKSLKHQQLPSDSNLKIP